MSGIAEVTVALAIGSVSVCSLGMCGTAHLKQALRTNSSKVTGLMSLATEAFSESSSTIRVPGIDKKPLVPAIQPVEYELNGGGKHQAFAELRGEVLLVGTRAERAGLQPTITLGGTEVLRAGRTVTISAKARDVSIKFENDEQAMLWVEKIRRGARMLPPAGRVHHLVNHIAKLEKLLSDVQGKTEKLNEELESKGKALTAFERQAAKAEQDERHLRRLKSCPVLGQEYSNDDDFGDGSADLQQQVMSTEADNVSLNAKLKAALAEQLLEASEVRKWRRRAEEAETMLAAIEQERAALGESADLVSNGEEALLQRLDEEREAIREHLTRDFEVQYSEIQREVSQARSEAQQHLQAREILTEQIAEDSGHLAQHLEDVRSAQAKEIAKIEAEYEERIRVLERGARSVPSTEEYEDLHRRFESAQAEFLDDHFAATQKHEALEAELLGAVRFAQEAGQQAEQDRGKAMTLQMECEALHEQALQQAQHAAPVLRALLAPPKPHDEELIAKLNDENRMMKEQMATTCAQINAQMLRLDEERKRFAEAHSPRRGGAALGAAFVGGSFIGLSGAANAATAARAASGAANVANVFRSTSASGLHPSQNALHVPGQASRFVVSRRSSASAPGGLPCSSPGRDLGRVPRLDFASPGSIGAVSLAAIAQGRLLPTAAMLQPLTSSGLHDWRAGSPAAPRATVGSPPPTSGRLLTQTVSTRPLSTNRITFMASAPQVTSGRHGY